MKKQKLKQIIKEEISKISNKNEGLIKGNILDVIDELNNLPFTGHAYKKGHEIHYFLDNNNVEKEARVVKKLAKSLGWYLKEDKIDVLIFNI